MVAFDSGIARRIREVLGERSGRLGFAVFKLYSHIAGKAAQVTPWGQRQTP